LSLNNEHYNTTDSSLATYIITQGYPLLEIDYSNQRFIYIFDGDPTKLKLCEHAYIAGNAQVDPSIYSRVYHKLMRAVKNRIQWGRA